MEIQLTWKTKLFSNRFEVFRYDMKSGELKKEIWSRKVNGELNSRKIIFETKGFFEQQTQIINLQDNAVVGRITFHRWKAKATINYSGSEYRFQFDNFFRSKWSLSNENGLLIRFHSRGFKGTIISYTKDEILILSTFFIRNFLKQKSAEMAAAS